MRGNRACSQRCGQRAAREKIIKIKTNQTSNHYIIIKCAVEHYRAEKSEDSDVAR